jgi:hypothetical protein
LGHIPEIGSSYAPVMLDHPPKKNTLAKRPISFLEQNGSLPPRKWLKGQIADLLSSPQVVEWLTLEPS